MADWIHKEVTYSPHVERQSHGIKYFTGYEIINNLPVLTKKILTKPPTTVKEKKKWEKEAREIAEWWLTGARLTLVGFLNLHCAEGWELFKISKDFRGSGNSWCIFRKKE